MIENRAGRLVKGPIRLGYVDERDLCSNKELFDFLRTAMLDHPFRPRGGSLIDNDIPEGDPEGPLPPVPPVSPSDFDPEKADEKDRPSRKAPPKPDSNPPDDLDDLDIAFGKDEPLTGGPDDEGN